MRWIYFDGTSQRFAMNRWKQSEGFLISSGAPDRTECGSSKFVPAQPSGKEHGGLLAVPHGVAGRSCGDGARLRNVSRQTMGNPDHCADRGRIRRRRDQSLQFSARLPTMPGSRFLQVHSRQPAGRAQVYRCGTSRDHRREAVAGHYLRNHGPSQKWYWRFVWTLPQSLSLYGHAQASIHNARVNLGCNAAVPECH